MEGGENVENSGDGGGAKPQNKEGTVDEEEGIHPLQTKEKSNERNKEPISKQEESEDVSVKLEESREHNLATSVTSSERDGEKDVKEMKCKPTESSALSKDATPLESKTADDMKYSIERDDDSLCKLSSDLSSQSGSAQMKIPQHKKDKIAPHEVIKDKEDTSVQSTDSLQQNKSNETTSSDELIDIKEITNGEMSSNIAQQVERAELKANEEKDTRKQEEKVSEDSATYTVDVGMASISIKPEINYVDFEEKHITITEVDSSNNEDVVDSDKNDFMLEKQLNESLQPNEKTPNEKPMNLASEVKQPPDKSKGKRDSIRTTQEKKREIASTASETIKPSTHKTDTISKTVLKTYLRTDVDNKPTKSKSMELNRTNKDEKKVKQKQTKDINTLAPNHRIKSPGRKDTLENSKQKSASTGTLSKSLENKQKQCEPQSSAAQEKSVKTKATKNASFHSPVKPQLKNPSEKLYPKNIENSNDDVTEKPVHSVFEGTVSRPVKCEEKTQRSVAEARKNQERMNKVTAEITATTEAAIKEQFKQLESKLPCEIPVQNKPSSPKQLTKSPMRKQAQQRQQKLQDQKQMLQKQTSPQKQKPARSPTRKQQEQKMQQKQQPLKQQQKNQQIKKELAQSKQSTTQAQPITLPKQGKQHVEIKHALQNQEEISLLKQQENQECPLPEQKQKQQANKVQQQVLIPKQKPQVKQIKQQDETEKHQQEIMQEQTVPYLKEAKDEEQKEQCEKPLMQQDKETIEQHNLQQKQKEQEEAMEKQLDNDEQGKQQRKEDQPNKTEQKEHPKQQLQQSEDGDEEAGVCGMQGKSCPIYFGVKSYLHHFYDSTPIKGSPLYEEYIEEDDFEYAVDPMKNRGCRRCCRGFWFRAGLWGGINLILVGVITLLVGYLTPQREMVVGHHNNLEILDRSAIAFNRRLELCRLAGLAVFCCGGLVLLLTLLLSSFLHVGSHNNNNSQCCGDNTYYGYISTSLVEPFIAAPNQTVPVSAGIRIPITEQIKSVQPTLWPDIATVKDGSLVPHLP